MKKFWMVYGGGNMTRQHATREAANTEAERLATEEPGKSFYVLEAVASVTVPIGAAVWDGVDCDPGQQTEVWPKFFRNVGDSHVWVYTEIKANRCINVAEHLITRAVDAIDDPGHIPCTRAEAEKLLGKRIVVDGQTVRLEAKS